MVEHVSYAFLFRSFLKIGLTSFGGHAALVSVLQEELVKKKSVIPDSAIMDGLSIASFLPGPLAVNVCTFIGYRLRGWPGALISMFAVLIPPFLLIIVIAYFYSRHGDLQPVNSFLNGVIPVIIGLILSLSFNLFKKHISKTWQIVLFAFALVAAFFYNTYFWIVIYIAIGGIVGFLFKEAATETQPAEVQPTTHSRSHLITGLCIIILTFVVFYFVLDGVNRDLLFEFAKVSLTLFGGGYVMIPILHDIVVEQFHWLDAQEFANAIAFGQITPGPILVSATYVGFRVGDVLGAFLATYGIFIPSASLMVFVGSVFDKWKDHPTITGIMMGIRPVNIGLIAYSGWLLFESLDHKLFSGLITALTFFVITFTRFNYFLLILMGGVLGLLFF